MSLGSELRPAWTAFITCVERASGCPRPLILLVPESGPTQGPCWCLHMHPSVKTDSSSKVSGSRQDILWAGSPSFPWPLPRLRIFSTTVILDNVTLVTCVTRDHNNEENVGALSSTQSGVSCWPFISRYQQDAQGFPGGAMIKNLPTNAGDEGDLGSIPGLGRSPGVGNGMPLQYSCLGDPLVREAWGSMGSERVRHD